MVAENEKPRTELTEEERGHCQWLHDNIPHLSPLLSSDHIRLVLIYNKKTKELGMYPSESHLPALVGLVEMARFNFLQGLGELPQEEGTSIIAPPSSLDPEKLRTRT